MTERPRARRFLANVRWGEHLWGPGSLTIGTGELEVAGLRRRETLSPSDVTVDAAILWVPSGERLCPFRGRRGGAPRARDSTVDAPSGDPKLWTGWLPRPQEAGACSALGRTPGVGTPKCRSRADLAPRFDVV